ncbi:MAG: hypothetical protein J6R20_00460, partial [Clostridia bacterium]|nr:hypothetical protein [Clostridia bacterium]
ATTGTQAAAYSLMRMRTAALEVEQTEEPEVVTDEDGNSVINVSLKTSSDVDHLVITDEDGNPISSQNVDIISAPIDGEDSIEWLVTITESKAGTHTFVIAGAYGNGYVDGSKAVTVTVTIEEPEVPEETTTVPEETTKPEDTTVPEETTKPEDTTVPEETTKPEDTTVPEETTKPSEPEDTTSTTKPADPNEPTAPEETTAPDDVHEDDYTVFKAIINFLENAFSKTMSFLTMVYEFIVNLF